MELTRVSPIAGILCVISFMALWIAAVVIDGNWVLGENTLSDLGVCGNDAAELCFNGGCAIAGLLAVIFALGLIEKKGVWRVCGACMAIAGVMLIGVGIVSLHYNNAHFIDASTHGVFAAITMLLSLAGDWKEGNKKMVAITSVLVIACVIVTLTQKFEVYEPYAVVTVMVWALAQSIKLLMQANNSVPNNAEKQEVA
ncbi:MAG: DUF998 domain-containing protein [Candidatus Methanomethylophilaceae archaeon]|nr:DUF998 domain-containing protein [Candidatus Methanomethylophilaceae archaeon]